MQRRTFVKAAGLTLLLPQLESFGQEPINPVKRLFTVVNHLGFYQPALLPDQESPVLLKNLEAHRENLKIFSGMDNPGVQLGNGHTPCVGVLSGYFNKLQRKNRISFDQQAAELLGGETRFQSLALQAGQNLNFSQVCWDRHGLPVYQMDSPERIFNLLFGVDENHAQQKQILAEEKSILDMAYEHAKSMSKDLSHRDREKVDDYFTSVREVEKSVRKRVFWSDSDKPHTDYELPQYSNRSVEDYLQVMLDLSLLAFETDSTRVVTLQIPFWESFSQDNIVGSYHDFSHHGKKQSKIDKLLVMENMILGKIGSTLANMKSKSMSAGRNLFEETSTLVTASMGNASAHTFDDLPALYFNGSVKQFQHEVRKNRPICDVYLSILQDLGIEEDVFGESESTVSLT
ncbi:DUF1552 domain-containing protein [Aureliella helgolandensis]|uniref:DUF1552 domain-containing protein n=1 Tax=Aureliella helgolandensis TaxID=2527968 RepID=A0A518G9D0_9BACT|nr:DUF1552 domain-containing protein [Aureliella helgolandensis]QDV25191.1 hypothetical protein Q31a_35140 [Aureliella helgolandensis]